MGEAVEHLQTVVVEVGVVDLHLMEVVVDQVVEERELTAVYCLQEVAEVVGREYYPLVVVEVEKGVVVELVLVLVVYSSPELVEPFVVVLEPLVGIVALVPVQEGC